MNRTILAALTSSALLLAACATTQDEAQPGAATSLGAQAQPQSPGRDSIASVDLTAGKKDPGSLLKDPDNLLSRRSIYYDYGRFEIKDEYRGIVEVHAKYLRENPGRKVLIEGNADERGSREYNVGLGQRRSDNVKKMLLLLGAREDQIESVSLGKEKPVCTEHNEACWWKNRRGDIRYAGES